MADKKPVVFMADLTYDTTVISIEYFPIGIGYVTAYAMKMLPDTFDFRIYKFPNDVLDAIDAAPPEILALSFFAWNKNLALFVADYYKQRKPDGVVVLGGPAIADAPERRKKFFLDNTQVDAFVLYDGEPGFVEVLKRWLAEPNAANWHDPIGGTLFLDRTAEALRLGEIMPRPASIDEYPSPYLTGLLDQFFPNEQLTPMIQSTRGCPFTCGYCWAGNGYNSKIRHFSLERISAELDYIAERRKDSINKLLVFSDSNFCMYAEDEAIAEKLSELQKKYGFPSSFCAPLGKNNKDRVFRIIRKIKNSVAIVSVQSTNPTILANVRRQPFDKELHEKIVSQFRAEGVPVETEVITGLPGETRETHLQTLRDVIDIGINEIHPFTLMFLEGSELDLPEAEEKYQWDRRYRILPRNFGKYRGKPCFEIEAVGVGSNTFTFDDYLFARGFHVILRIVFNNAFYVEFTQYLSQAGLDLFDFCMQFYNTITTDPSPVGDKLRAFIGETRDELWMSPAEVVDFYTSGDNYQLLLNGDRGENLLGKFKTLTICEGFDEWCEFYHGEVLRFVTERAPRPDVAAELEDVKNHILAKADRVLSEDNMNGVPVAVTSGHDVVQWVADAFARPLSTYRLPEPATFEYRIPADMQPIVREILTLNTTKSALWKAVASRYYLPTLFRRGAAVSSANQLQAVGK